MKEYESDKESELNELKDFLEGESKRLKANYQNFIKKEH